MIQKLAAKIVSLLIEKLVSVVPNANQNIKAGLFKPPNNVNTPLVIVGPGSFRISQQPGEVLSSEPRLEETRQSFVVDESSPLGPYQLTKLPLQGSVRCKVFLNEETVLERQIWLQEQKDFTVDYSTGDCSFIYDVSGSDRILFIYSTVSAFILQDFEQDLLIEVYALNTEQAEQLSSLIAGILLVNHDALVSAYNQDPVYKTEYNAGGVGTTHQINRIQLLTGTLESNPLLKTSLKFTIKGHLKATRELTEGFGLIEKVHSPSRISDQPIDIAINVE